MKKQIKDERIIQEARQQNSMGFAILYFGVLIDLLYRQFILQEPISRYWDLALLFFGVTFYLAAKRVYSGIFTNKPDLSSLLLSSIIATGVFTIVNYWYLGNTTPVELITGGVIFLLGFYLINLLMQYISSKKNDDLLR